MLPAPFFRQDPRPAHQRRLMTHMLAVTAGKIRDPIAALILVIADDGLVHGLGIQRTAAREIGGHSVWIGLLDPILQLATDVTLPAQLDFNMRCALR